MQAPGTAPDAVGERRRRLAAARLYLVCDASPGGGDLTQVLHRAIAGGVDLVQLRDKRLAEPELLRAADVAGRVCQEHGVLFLVNDHPRVAVAVGADGVHVGQRDTPVAEAREILGPEALIGLSTHTPAQIEAAGDAGGEGAPGERRGRADYIGVGPVFATPTKPGRRPVGTALVAHAAARSVLPFFAIGGIDRSTIGAVLAAGASRVAVVRAIAGSPDPEGAARELRVALGSPPEMEAGAREHTGTAA